MFKIWPIISGFALLGFTVAAGEWAYTQYAARHHILIGAETVKFFLYLNPGAIFVFLPDTEIPETQLPPLQLIIVFCNSALYGVVGTVIGMLLWVVGRLLAITKTKT